MGMAGNVGVQTATVTVRGLATGVLASQRAGAMIFKELRVGLMLGLVYSALLGAFGWFFFGDIKLAEVVVLTLLINMTGASVLAIVLPLTFDRLGADPAIATGPFVTTAIDVFGVLNYFLIANAVMGLV
jgi:magnesium transporter